METQLETAQGASGFVSHLRSRFGSVLVWSQDEVAAVIKLQWPLMCKVIVGRNVEIKWLTLTLLVKSLQLLWLQNSRASKVPANLFMIEAGWRLLDEGKTGRLSFHPLFSCRNVHLDFDQPLLWEIFMVCKFVVPRFFKAARKSGFHGNMKRQKTREAACCQCRYWLLYQSIELPVAFMNTLDIICRLWAELDKSGKGYVTLEELTSLAILLATRVHQSHQSSKFNIWRFVGVRT